MKFILTYLFSLTFVVSYSQTNNFAPIGATWWYDALTDCGGIGNLCGYFTLTSVNDTIIEGKNCRLIVEDHFEVGSSYPTLYHYLYEDSGKVFLFRDEQFHLLYDFNSNALDTISVFESPFTGFTPFEDFSYDKYNYVIDSTSTTIIDGTELKVQYHSQLGSSLDWSMGNGEIIEHIGSTSLFFGLPNVITPEFGSFLRCYQDSNIFYKNYLNECDFITGLNNTLPEYFDIQPNPVVDLVQCTNNSFFDGNIMIYNLLGSLVYSGPIQPNSSLTVDLSKYAGLIIAVVHFSNSQTYSFNILKM